METETINKEQISPITDKKLENAVIYEANIRQYSDEGTFEAFTRDIPKLKELGVKIIWLMPVYPISKKKRKATPELMADQIEDPVERENLFQQLVDRLYEVGKATEAASHLEIDAVIDPLDTRRVILQALAAAGGCP